MIKFYYYSRTFCTRATKLNCAKLFRDSIAKITCFHLISISTQNIVKKHNCFKSEW